MHLWMKATEFEEYITASLANYNIRYIMLPVRAGTHTEIAIKYNERTASFNFSAHIMIIPMIIDQHYVAVLLDKQNNKALYMDSLMNSNHRIHRYDACCRVLQNVLNVNMIRTQIQLTPQLFAD